MLNEEKKEKNYKVRINAVLSKDLMDRWLALTVNSSRSNSDALKLLLKISIDSKRGRELLKIGGYDNFELENVV